MRLLRPSRLLLVTIALPALVLSPVGYGETDEGDGASELVDPNRILHESLDQHEPGKIPGTFFALDGRWSLVEVDGGIALELASDPLIEAQLQIGESMKETGGRIRARIKAERKRRSLPRFGVGLHGASGYRLRIFPAQERLELVKADEVMQSIELEWNPGEWWFLELSAEPAGDAWTITGRAWAESEERPTAAQIDYISTDTRFFGRPSLTGTPFAGLPIWFDDIEVWKAAPEESDSRSK